MAIAIFLFTLILVIWQPRGIGIGFAAMLGALLALVTGVVTGQDLQTVLLLVGNGTFTVSALLIIALIFDAAGFFQRLALILARVAMGNGRLLFFFVILGGVLITAFLTNYGAVLIWTPTVLELLLLLRFNRSKTLAFVFATGFIADVTSLALPFSNLVNMISIDYFQIGFWRYVLVMMPINFVAIAVSLAVLWFYFERHIPKQYNLQELPLPVTAIRDSLICRCLPIFGLLLIAYFLSSLTSVAVIPGISALIMLALAGRWFTPKATTFIEIRKIWQALPWQVLLFSLGMSVVVIGLHDDGMISLLSEQFIKLSGWGLTLAATGTGLLAMVLSGIFNNLPTVFINALAMPDASQIDPVVREVMVYANVLGCNIGAKITPIGSFGTILWFGVLAAKGFTLSWVEYVRLSFILSIPVLWASLLALVLWLPWLTA